MSLYGERMARIEKDVEQLKIRAEENKVENDKQFAEVNEKLDNLLALRDKGVGVFWLASIIFGTGIAGAFLALFNWIVGK